MFETYMTNHFVYTFFDNIYQKLLQPLFFYNFLPFTFYLSHLPLLPSLCIPAQMLNLLFSKGKVGSAGGRGGGGGREERKGWMAGGACGMRWRPPAAGMVVRTRPAPRHPLYGWSSLQPS